MKFREFQPPLCEEILAEVDALGFSHMTPVQAATLPLFLSNKDVCVDACTGSGKTLAFVLPIVQLLKRKLADGSVAAPAKSADFAKLLAMVISPTRELARQIFDCAAPFFARAIGDSVRPLLFVGGTSVEEDLTLVRQAAGRCAVVIGTPGRTEDLLNRCVGTRFDAREFEILILDEADTLLDMGFEVSLNKILEHLPKQRRTGLFSATQTQEVKALARAGLRNPATISVQVAGSKDNAQITPSTLDNYYCLVGHDQRLSALHHFLTTKRSEKLLVFFSTCSAVDFFGRLLEELLADKDGDAFPVVMLHGKMLQKKRTAHYDQFVGLKSGVLVCTDVVARGIDLPDVDWIVQYDPPQDPNFFVHRVGRTARAGRSGCALSFLSSNEDAYVNYLKIRKVPSEEMELPLDTMPDVLPRVKQLILSDRDLLEKGTKAFISFVRSYKEHQCQFIFRFKELDLGAVARGFCLLQLPKINELRNIKVNFEPAADVKAVDIKYKDKAREKERQKKLVEIAKEKEKREEQRKHGDHGKKRKHPEADDEDAGGKHAPRRREKKKGFHQQIVEEWDELAEEEKLFKKLKKGKITEEEYEKVLLGKADSSDDDGDDDGDSDDDTGAGKKAKRAKRAEEKLKERFKKKEQLKRKTGDQKREAAKREERIRQRKKRQHVQRQQQKELRRGRK